MQEVLAEGVLLKHSPNKALVKRWQTRYFVLSPSFLTYYKKKGDAPQGTIDLTQIRSVRQKGDNTSGPGGGKAVFQVETVGGRTYVLAADTHSGARRWVEIIQFAVEAPNSPPSNPAQTKPPKRTERRSFITDRPTQRGGEWKLLTGERMLTKQENVLFSHHSLSEGRWGQLHMSTYRLIFASKGQSDSIPLGLVMRVESAKHEDRGLSGYLLVCKDFRTISIFFLHPEALETMSSLFKHVLFPQRIGNLYAFHNKENYALRSEMNGWPLYQIDKEFERQNLDLGMWRVTNLNRAHKLPSVPNRFIVPASSSDDMIGQLSDRQLLKWQQWLLALCWGGAPRSSTRGCLMRAWPLTSAANLDCLEIVGANSKRVPGSVVTIGGSGGGSSPQQRMSMLEHVLMLHPEAQALHVYNTALLRKKLFVLGSESPALESVQVEAGTIRFHATKLLSPAAVEKSLVKLAVLVGSLDTPRFQGSAVSVKGSDDMTLQKAKAAWRDALRETQWLEGVRQLLDTTLDIVNLIVSGDPVLVQSADGEGAIPQVVCLVQLCLDPYFRTTAGFCFLIEKEWMACAHKWGQQHKAKYLPKQYSHMFVQFIDAVWQLWDCMPSVFQFDKSLLLFLLESVYSARFGTFLVDKQRDRLKGKLLLSSTTISVWSYVDSNMAEFANEDYNRHDSSMLVPMLPQPDQVKLWTDYYLRWACHAPGEKVMKDLYIREQANQGTGGQLSMRAHALHAVPAAVTSFPGVSVLDLSYNFISTLSFGLSAFAGLESLDLSHNLLTGLPAHLVASLPLLPRLARLDLSHNDLNDLSALPSLRMGSLAHLDVSHNALRAIPSHLEHLTGLQYLNLGFNSIGSDQGKRGQLDVVCSLTTLTTLILAGNSFASVPPQFFVSHAGLEVLDLSGCGLTKLPMGIAQLAKLRVLHLSNNPNLRGFPSDLWSLSSLQELYAHNCLGFGRDSTSSKSSSILSPHVSLARWKRASAKAGPNSGGVDEPVATLPAGFGQLTELRCLDISRNGIAAVPAGCLAKLVKLERLWLSGNALAALPGADVGSLSSLQELDVSYNRLTSLPPEIAGLQRLTSLNLEGNLLTELPAQLSTLPLLDKLQVGFQNGCIRSPPQEIIEMGSSSILAYLTQLLNGQQPCYRMKLMFVGQENVGKTSLLNALMRRDKKKAADDAALAQPLSTDGIDINKWKMTMPWGPHAPQIDISAWDFAGQEIYYATHRFFLSERSLYLVVFNVLASDQSQIEYWLHSVRTSAGNSPVLLIGTHAEDERCTDEYLTTLYTRLEARLAERFSNLAGVHFVSCVTGKGLDQLQAALQAIVAKQEHIGQPLPSSYLELEKILVNQTQGRKPPIVSWNEYRSLAKLCLIEREQDLLTATSLLHNFGSLVHFPNDEKLKDMVILEPQWLMDVMSTVVSTKHTYCRNGVMAQSALPHIWKAPEFPEQMHPFILSLLERFEISFPVGPHIHKLGCYASSLRPTPALGDDADGATDGGLKDSRGGDDSLYLIPSLLPEARPAGLSDQWPSTAAPGESLFGRSYRFEFIPKGFMGRLIIRLLAFPLAAQLYWRNGVLAQIGSEKILLELFPEDMQLKILVRTELRGEQMSNLLWLVFAAADTLVKEWYNLNAKVLVPCGHCLGRSLKTSPFMFPLEKCQQAATMPGQSILFCPHECSDTGDPKPVRLDHIAPDLAMVHLDRHKIKWSDLQKEESPMAKGGFSAVYRGTYLGEPVAIKEIKSAEVDGFDTRGINIDAESRRLTFEEFRHEVWIMSGLAHPNLVGLKGFCMQPPCIVTELVSGGSLFDFLSDPERNRVLDWPLRLKIAKDIAKGCAFLHNTSPPVMHRDLKSPNILLVNLSPNAAVVAKLCDFGVSLTADTTAGRKVDCPVWLAPEILDQKPYTEKADVYSIGVIFWELLTKEQYFGEVQFMAILEDMVKQGKRPPIPDSCIPSYRNLIEQCWAPDPDQRPSCKEIVGRIEGIIRGVCPEIANYDATAELDFRRALAAEQERRRAAQQPRHKEKMHAMQMVSMRSIMAAEPKKKLLSQSIKDMALSKCNRNEIIEFMEEFLKLRKEGLMQCEMMPLDDQADGGNVSGQGGQDDDKRVQEISWIDNFLARLHEDRAPQQQLLLTSQEDTTCWSPTDASSVPAGVESDETGADSVQTTIDEGHQTMPVSDDDDYDPQQSVKEEAAAAPSSPLPSSPLPPAAASGGEWRKSQHGSVHKTNSPRAGEWRRSERLGRAPSSPSSPPASPLLTSPTKDGERSWGAVPSSAGKSSRARSPKLGAITWASGSPPDSDVPAPSLSPTTIREVPTATLSRSSKEEEEQVEEKKVKKKKKKKVKKEKIVTRREQRSDTVAQMKTQLDTIEKDLSEVLAAFEKELHSP